MFLLSVTGNTTGQDTSGIPRSMTAAVSNFLGKLSQQQKATALFPFGDPERFHWNFVPMPRKGIALKDLNREQYNSLLDVLRSGLSDTGFNKTTAIIRLEKILREVENRGPDDEYRHPGKYYFSVFGTPSKDTAWGWRFEGHHIAYNFTIDKDELVSVTPGFLGANPAVVLSGADKGMQVLKDETELGLAMLQSLDENQKALAIISESAPGDILTGNNRKAMIKTPEGILYSQLNASQQRIMLQLTSLYLYRYSRAGAAQMMAEIEKAGLPSLRFAWAGDRLTGVGHPHYYRIHGPTIIIEYDNIQNNANHVHTVIRDLKNDFGDQLLEHYKTTKHH